MSKERRALWISILLGVLTLAAFWPVLRNGFVFYDDPDYVTDNPHVVYGLVWHNVLWAFGTGAAANWHPLTWISHMLDVELFGLNPAGHHLVNMLLHTVNALLLFHFLRRWSGSIWRSAMVATLFAIHPLHVESVAWVAERKDVLSTLFFLLTLWAYAEYAEKSKVQSPKSKVQNAESTVHGPRSTVAGAEATSQGSTIAVQGSGVAPRVGGLQVGVRLAKTEHADREEALERFFSNRWFFYGLALGLFALGLMSKPMLVTLPCVLLLLDGWPLGRLEFTVPAFRRLVGEKVPFVALAIVSCVVTYAVQSHAHARTSILPLAARASNAVASYWKYLGKTFWPVNLAVFYPHPETRFPVSHQWPMWVIAIAAILLLVLAVGAGLSLKRRPWLAFGWFWYLGTLVPVIGLIQVGGQAMADRYTYIPLIGFFVCVVWGAAELMTNRASKEAVFATTALLAVAGCVVLTRQQVEYWQNDYTLFKHTLEVTTDNATAHFHVGNALRQQGKADQAVEHYRAVVEAAPAISDGYYGLGVSLEARGDLQGAIQNYHTALKLAPWNAHTHNDLGSALWQVGRREEAMAEYAEALRLAPECAELYINIGIARSSQGDLEAAAKDFTQALRLKPGYEDALSRLAELRLKQGKLPEAEGFYRQWVNVNPTNAQAQLNLGAMLWRRGQRGEALERYVQAVHLEPKLPAARYNLGSALLSMGRPVEAAVEFSEVVQLKPDYLEAQVSLGRALAGQGRFEEAQVPFRAAARLCPTNADLHLFLGTALRMAGKTNEAIAAFQDALRLEPDLAQRNQQAGKALLAQGQFDAAAARLSTALWLNPNDPEVHDNLGAVLKQQGKTNEAAAQFEEAARLRTKQ